MALVRDNEDIRVYRHILIRDSGDIGVYIYGIRDYGDKSLQTWYQLETMETVYMELVRNNRDISVYRHGISRR